MINPNITKIKIQKLKCSVITWKLLYNCCDSKLLNVIHNKKNNASEIMIKTIRMNEILVPLYNKEILEIRTEHISIIIPTS